MLKVNEDVEVHRYEYGWELRILRDKMPTFQHPNPIGKTCDTTYHSTLEQSLVAALDKMPDCDSGGILRAIRLAKEEILYALQREAKSE